MHSPLWDAAFWGKLEVVKALLDDESQVSITIDGIECETTQVLDIDSIESPEGTTPLAEAAMHGYTSIVVSLLDAGADPSFPSIWGLTPLRYACRFNHVEVIELFHCRRLYSCFDAITSDDAYVGGYRVHECLIFLGCHPTQSSLDDLCTYNLQYIHARCRANERRRSIQTGMLCVRRIAGNRRINKDIRKKIGTMLRFM